MLWPPLAKPLAAAFTLPTAIDSIPPTRLPDESSYILYPSAAPYWDSYSEALFDLPQPFDRFLQPLSVGVHQRHLQLKLNGLVTSLVAFLITCLAAPGYRSGYLHEDGGQPVILSLLPRWLLASFSEPIFPHIAERNRALFRQL